MKNPVQAPAGANPDGRHRRRVVRRQPTLPGRTISSGATRQVRRSNTGRGRKPQSAHREDGAGATPSVLPRAGLRRAAVGVRRGSAAPPRQSPLVRTRGRLAMMPNGCHSQPPCLLICRPSVSLHRPDLRRRPPGSSRAPALSFRCPSALDPCPGLMSACAPVRAFTHSAGGV